MAHDADDRPLIAAGLAELIGNARFAAPSDRVAIVAASHAAAAVDESLPIVERLRAWSTVIAGADSRRASLVLSVHAMRVAATLRPAEQSAARDRFDLNKFHHLQAELQEQLRQTLSFRVDRPLHLGLGDEADESEKTLADDVMILRGVTHLAVEISCQTQTTARLPRRNEPPSIVLARPIASDTFSLRPWPLATSPAEIRLTGRTIAFVDY